METGASPLTAKGTQLWIGGLGTAIAGMMATLVLAPGALSQSSALVSVTPVAVSLGPSQTQQFQATSIRAKTSVYWSLTPSVGSISKDGLYTAPPSVTSQVTVTVTATTVYPPIVAGTAAITLTPISPMTLGPGRVNLWASQAAQFTVTGGATGVNWSMNPVVGTLSNGLYTAPSVINTAQSVTITATSSSDSAQKASSLIQLWPVSVSVAPTSVKLSGGGSLQFWASVAGNWNSGVTWSVSPPVGSITNGLYTAPATITKLQTIVLTAASVADPSRTAQATITLTPPRIVGLSVNPGATALMAGQGQQFTAVDQNGQNTPVNWSINPPVGNMTSNGVYSGPLTVDRPQTVTVTATSTVDPTQSTSVALSLAGNIRLPIEVMGADGTTASVGFCIPQGTNISGQLLLSMKIHGLHYETQASVQLNNSAWLPINTSSVTLQGPASAYGGIGGGFSTFQMTTNVPAGALATGLNTLTFRFNQTDGRVSGFRVLAFNILAADGSQLLPSGSFVYDDPNTWLPPLNTPTDIAAGKTAWYQATLTTPTPTGPVTIQANCASCHSQDGRDLKYFNYSNNSIRTRAVFHGLTAQQGDQIASYIRTLAVANPGRPWNPPYQPGPGLDSQPAINWAAGAGVDAVLSDYQTMMNGMFPSGINNSMFSASGNLNIRETAVPLQLPDWNQWLPGIHPMDAFGSTFTTSGYNTIYQAIRSNLKVLDANAYAAQVPLFDNWANANYELYVTEGGPLWNNPALWTPQVVEEMYSLQKWGMVKSWEMMNEFQLEGFGQQAFGSQFAAGPQLNPSQADQRAWYSVQSFRTSPNMLKMPQGVAGLGNGSYATYLYHSFIWYQLQLILNNSNHQPHDTGPIDWGYTYSFIQHMGTLVPGNAPLQMMWLMKDLQVSHNGLGPDLGAWGWNPTANNLGWLFTQMALKSVWQGVPFSTRAALLTGILSGWLAQVQQFTPQQFYTGGFASPTVNPIPGNGQLGDWVWDMLPRFKTLGVDATLLSQTAQWAQTVWPNANWTADLNQSCTPPDGNGGMSCTQ